VHLHRRLEVPVDPGLFLLVLALGSAGIAVWIDVRFPRLDPADLARVIVHVVIAIVVARLGVPAGIHLLGSWGLALVSIFAIALPALVYLWLAGWWTMKAIQRKLAHLG
jgi:hypothetical protein